MGVSGSGKSTLFNVLGLLDDVDAGTYTLARHDAGHLNDGAAARMRNELLGVIFQSVQLLADKDAIDNVALPFTYRDTSREEHRQRAIAMLERVGLGDRLEKGPKYTIHEIL